MIIKRVAELPAKLQAKVYQRLKNGSMKVYYDDEQYWCYDEDELINWKPAKRGRKTKIKE